MSDLSATETALVLAVNIIHQLGEALQDLEAPPELLSIIGSYGDTLEDSEVLRLLKDWNATGKVMWERQ